MRTQTLLMLTAALTLGAAHPSAAEHPSRHPCAVDADAKPSAARRGVAVAAAVVPGVVAHGLGHWVNGQPCTAARLANAEAIGVGGVLVGGSGIVLTGASRYFTGPAIALTIGGFSLIISSYLADIYGVSGVARYGFEPERLRPSWETEVGLLRVRNPLFAFEWLLTQKVAKNFGMGRVVAALDTSMDGAHARYRLGTALRAVGPRPNVGARDGSFFDLYAGIGEQRYVMSGFVTDSGELQVTGRLDLARIGPTLRGSFAELSTGMMILRTGYRLDGIFVEPDIESLLLGRIAFGAYLGRRVHRGSEAMLYYDHRHDDYAAGLKLPGLGSGTIGHLGASLRYFVSRHWGLGAVAEAGSAYVAGITLLFRAGGGS